MGTVKNLSYFKQEDAKNRDMWKYADSGSNGLANGYNQKTDSLYSNMYANGKFDDVIRYQAPKRLWRNAEGEEQELENEDYTEYENEAEEIPEEQFAPDELPKFRQLVRAKKLELKAQYGKAHFDTRRECKMVPTPSTCYKTVSIPYPCIKNAKATTCYKNSSVPYPCTVNKEVCINIPTWVWGWRKKWREFKQAGGLAQLKMISRGMAPMPTPTTNDPNTPTYTPTPTPRGGGKRSVGEQIDLNHLGEQDVIQEASIGKNIFGTILVLGLVFGAIRMMK